MVKKKNTFFSRMNWYTTFTPHTYPFEIIYDLFLRLYIYIQLIVANSRPYDQGLWKLLVSLNKASLNPYFWRRYVGGGRLTGHTTIRKQTPTFGDYSSNLFRLKDASHLTGPVGFNLFQSTIFVVEYEYVETSTTHKWCFSRHFAIQNDWFFSEKRQEETSWLPEPLFWDTPHGVSKTTCFEAPGVSLGGSGVSTVGGKIVRVPSIL